MLCITFKTYLLIFYINYKLLQDPRVLDAMMPYMTHSFGNPHSRTHMYGWESEEAVEIARHVIKVISINMFSLINLRMLLANIRFNRR